MSDALDQFKDDIEAAVKDATARLDDADKARLAEIVERSAVHASMGNTSALEVEASTAALLLWTESNERGKRARQAVINAVSRAVVQGLIAAL